MSVTDQRHRPLYPISQLATWELLRLREKLEEILANPELPPYARPRKDLQADLDAVIAEQDERAKVDRESREKAKAEGAGDEADLA